MRNGKSIFLAGLLLLLASLAHAHILHGGGNTTPEPFNSATETITANLASTSFTIPSNFVGFSEELADIAPGGAPYTGSLFQSSNTTLIGLIQLLGANGFIRIGGNSQDTPNNLTSSPPPLTSGIATGVNSFITALGSGWTISWGLSGKSQNTSTVVTQSGLILGAMSNSIVMFSLDNEPDLYSQSVATFQTNWNANYAALIGAAATAKVEAPELSATSGFTTWTTGLTPGASGLQFSSSHYYPGGHTVSTVINNAAASNFASEVAAAPGKWRLDETNMSFDNTIQPVLGQALMAATWYLNVSLNLARQGGIGISPHNFVSNAGATASFLGSPWPQNDWVLQGDGGWGPGSMFYGLFLMSKIEGQQIVANTATGNGNVNALCTKGVNGNANCLVVNNDNNAPIKIQPAQSAGWTTATALVLGPTTSTPTASCVDQSPKVGGQPIQEGGVWTGGTANVSNGGTVTVQPCGAVLFEIQP